MMKKHHEVNVKLNNLIIKMLISKKKVKNNKEVNINLKQVNLIEFHK